MTNHRFHLFLSISLKRPDCSFVQWILEEYSKLNLPNLLYFTDVTNEEAIDIELGELSPSELERLFDAHAKHGFDLTFRGESPFDQLLIGTKKANMLIALKIPKGHFEYQGAFESLCRVMKPEWGYFILPQETDRIKRSEDKLIFEKILPRGEIFSFLHFFSLPALKDFQLERAMKNPFISHEKFDEGILFKVMADPFILLEEAGKEKVLNANLWMVKS